MSSLPKSYKKIVTVKKSLNWDECTKVVDVEFPENLVLEKNTILLKLIYAGVNASDILQAAGGYGPVKDGKLPEKHDYSHQLGDSGAEGIAQVIQVAEGESKFKVGDYVGLLGFGTSFREYLITSTQTLFPIPFTPKKEVVAMFLTGLTAIISTYEEGRPKKNDVVFVSAAAGGTGQFLVQLNKALGAQVIGTCSTKEKAEFLKKLGCDRVINYKEDDISKVLKEEYKNGVNVFYDLVGGDIFNTVFTHMAVRGRIVVIGSIGEGYSKSTDKSKGFDFGSLLAKSLNFNGFFLRNYAETYPKYIGMLYESYLKGELKLFADETEFKGIESISKAQEFMTKGVNVGKIVITY